MYREMPGLCVLPRLISSSWVLVLFFILTSILIIDIHLIVSTRTATAIGQIIPETPYTGLRVIMYAYFGTACLDQSKAKQNEANSKAQSISKNKAKLLKRKAKRNLKGKLKAMLKQDS